MVTPAPISTSAQFRPRLGYAVADDAAASVPQRQINSEHQTTTYVVAEGDALGELASRLYGANVPQTRAKILNQGFYPGSEITI